MADFPDSTPVTEIPRQIVEAEIEMLIDLLDQLDADPDVEDGADIENDTTDDEPLLGAPNQQAGSWNGIDASYGCDDDEELELGWTEMEARFNRHFAAGSDVYEPSLGSTNSVNQANWSKGNLDDAEGDEHDGREPDCDDEDGGDDEWELGWTDLQARTGKYSYGLDWCVADGEPSLASMNRMNQVYWWQGRNDDREEQCDDEGAIDCDREPDHDNEGNDRL